MQILIDNLENGYIINKPGHYIINGNISSAVPSIKITCGNVVLDGSNHSLIQTDSTKPNIDGIEIAENVDNVTIKNIVFNGISGSCIKCCGNNNNIVISKVKTTNCCYNPGHDIWRIVRGKLGFMAPKPFVISFDGLVRNVSIEDCIFAETGIYRSDQNMYQVASGVIFVHQGKNITVKECTIDGCVGINVSIPIILVDIDNLLIDDLFVTDVYSSGKVQDIFTFDVDGEIKGYQKANIISGVSANDFCDYLDNHHNAKYDVEPNDKPIEASHLKNVVPMADENMQLLIDEHKWREFRTMGRLVCHNSHQKSKTSSVYAKWVELFCEKVLDVKVKVEAGFANLYRDGSIELPLHRDQYKKWIFGLSFGGTRTLDFVPDNPNKEIVPYEMKSGDVVMFSNDVNNRYQHRMLPEYEKEGQRVNLTYFLEVLPGQDENKLLNNDIDYGKIPMLESIVS